MKNKLGRNIMKKFVELKPIRCTTIAQMMYALTKKYVIKREIKFEHYKKCLQSNKTILRSILRVT